MGAASEGGGVNSILAGFAFSVFAKIMQSYAITLKIGMQLIWVIKTRLINSGTCAVVGKITGPAGMQNKALLI